jgi:hypothetical protein
MHPGPEVTREKSLRRQGRVLDRVLRDAGLRRRTFLAATGVAVIVVVLATVLVTVIPLSSFKTTSDRLTWAGDVLVGATLLLAAIAAIVALVAYAVSTGLPDIRISVEFRDSVPNNPEFLAESQDGWLRGIRRNFCTIWLLNESGYSAKNPAINVGLGTMAFGSEDESLRALDSKRIPYAKDWEVYDAIHIDDWLGNKQFQWDGGPTYSIHGHSTRRLPDLNFSEWRMLPTRGASPPLLTFEILAEGYRKVVTLPVNFVVDGKPRYPRERTLPEWI